MVRTLSFTLRGGGVSPAVKWLACWRAGVLAALLGILPASPGLHAEPVLIDQAGGFQSPTRVARASSGKVYVADYRRGVVAVFGCAGEQGRQARQTACPLARVGTLKGVAAPLGLAVLETREEGQEPQGGSRKRGGGGGAAYRHRESAALKVYAYVGDGTDGSVRIFLDGAPVGALGAGAGEFTKPNGIAVTSARTVYVADSEAHQVKVYGSDGSGLFSFGSRGAGEGRLDFPADVALNEAAGEVYVADFRNKRISVFDLSGNWLRHITPPLNSCGDPVFFRPAGLGADAQGLLYVVDNALSMVAVLSSAGELVNTIGLRYELDRCRYWTGDLSLPVDAASDGTLIYVTSNEERLLKVFEVSP